MTEVNNPISNPSLGYTRSRLLTNELLIKDLLDIRVVIFPTLILQQLVVPLYRQLNLAELGRRHASIGVDSRSPSDLRPEW